MIEERLLREAERDLNRDSVTGRPDTGTRIHLRTSSRPGMIRVEQDDLFLGRTMREFEIRVSKHAGCREIVRKVNSGLHQTPSISSIFQEGSPPRNRGG